MGATKCLLLFFYLGVSQQVNVLKRMLEFWEPHVVYVIYNSSNPKEDSLDTLTSPRYISARGTFSNFLPSKEPTTFFPNYFILVLITDDSCQSVIPILKLQLLQKTIVNRSKVVVIMQSAPKSRLDGYFKDIWEMGMLNVFFVDNSFIFTFNPFTNDFSIQHPSSDYHKLISIDRAGNWHGAVINVPQIELYPGAQNITWNNQRIEVGEYIFVRRPFEKFFNATLHVYVPEKVDLGFEIFNGTSSQIPTGLGGELVSGKAHVIFVTRAYGLSNYFDFVQPHLFGKCRMLVPRSMRIPQYTIVAKVAFGWVGISTIISLAVAVASLAVIKRVLRTDLEVTVSLLGLSSVFLGQSFKVQSSTTSLRLVIVSWLLVCISLSTLFNAQIVTSFLTPWFFKEYDDPFQALQGSGYSVYTFKDYYYYMQGNKKQLVGTEEKYQKLASRLVGVDRNEYFDRVHHPNGKDMFVVLGMGENLIIQTVHLTERMYSYHLTNPLFINIMSNIVPRGSIIYHRFDDFKYRVLEAGLQEYWQSLELLYDRKFGNANFTETHEQPLTVKDLYSAFLVLVLGQAFAATVFLVEMFVARFVK